MRSRVLAAVCPWFLVLSVGCGGTGSSSSGSVAPQSLGPHGGVTVALGEKAAAELVFEPVAGANPAAGSTRVVVYLLEADRSKPLASKGSAVSAKIATQEGESNVALAPDAEVKPGGDQRFVSQPGKYGDDQARGEIAATIEGQALSATFVGR